MNFKIFLLFSLFCAVTAYGQERYVSPITQHFSSSSEMDTITRTILFEPEAVTVTTETPSGKREQVFKLLKKENKNIEPIGSAILYTCTSGDENPTTYFIIPKVGIPHFIDVVHQAQAQQPENHYRYLLDISPNGFSPN